MKKITVKVSTDEWCPVIEPGRSDYFDEEIVVSEDLWKRYCAALETFQTLRNELNEAVDI